MLGIFCFKFSAYEFETKLSTNGGLVFVDADEQVSVASSGERREEAPPRVVSLLDCSHRLAESSGCQMRLTRELDDEPFRCWTFLRALDLEVVNVQGCVLHPCLDAVTYCLMSNHLFRTHNQNGGIRRTVEAIRQLDLRGRRLRLDDVKLP
eukprot:5368283-Pyramimonas_sp.AAC.1